MAIGTTNPWELRHQSGHYAFLNDLAEAPRYGVIAAHLGHGARGGRVLDAGCGEAILVRHLPADCIREYVGVDRSQTALDCAPRARVGDLRMQLVCADLDSYTPPAGESFDALVFNEVLYNLASPLDAVARCARHLAPGGIAVISMYAYNRSGRDCGTPCGSPASGSCSTKRSCRAPRAASAGASRCCNYAHDIRSSRMGTMGPYCKAYALAQFKAFDGWAGAASNIETLTDDDYLFLHGTYAVTKDVFLDEAIVFDRITPEWIAFCERTLSFEVPDYARAAEAPAEADATPA
jgi:SAM-dependent methyltransferase